MKTITVIATLSLVGMLWSCEAKKHEFELNITKVEHLKGFILKGLAVTGPVTNGCLAKEDAIVILRDGKEVMRENARILNVEGLTSSEEFSGEVNPGDVVSLYLPDRNLGDVLPGDKVISDTPGCSKSPDSKPAE